jgi:hypothetical protein
MKAISNLYVVLLKRLYSVRISNTVVALRAFAARTNL